MEKKIKKFYEEQPSYFKIVLLLIAFIITSISIITGSYIQDKENVEVGSVASKKYVAPVDAVNEIATEKLRQRARESVSPLYKQEPYVQNNAINDFNEFFNEIDNIIEKASVTNSIDSLIKSTSLKIPVALTGVQLNYYANLDDDSKTQYQQELKNIINYVYDQGITEDTLEKTYDIVSDRISQLSWSESLKNMGKTVINALLKPNLIIDSESMNAAMEQKASEINDIIIKKNQKIVDEGEIITQDIYDILDSLNLINKGYSDNAVPITGSVLVVFFCFAAVFLYFISQEKKLLKKLNKLLIVFVLYIMTVIILRIMAKVSDFTFIPITLFAMLISILVDVRLAVVLNLFVCIIGNFIFNGDMKFLIYFIVSGTFSALLAQYTNKKSHIVGISVCIGAVNAVSVISAGMFFENGYSLGLVREGLIASGAGIISMAVAIISLPFWEVVFQVNTSYKLLELTNPNNELLKRLMIETPGTYHHSLMVANLAETAACDIDANPILARVGAYYHDIGKLKNPICYSENQSMGNPHDKLDPYKSAEIIINHVIEGQKMADEYNLPNSIKDIIIQHHGTTLVKFFYYKAMKMNENETVNEEKFRYFGPKPQSRESAVVMLADTVEAAVRSNIKSGKSTEEIDELINQLIKGKLDDGQLDESGLVIKDLQVIRKSFLKVFQGVYHNRIAYPKDEEIKKADENNKRLIRGERN